MDHDPARAVLASVLEATVARGGFPLERSLREGLDGLASERLDRLIADGRYLARAIGAMSTGVSTARLAVTVRGHYEVDTAQGQAELQGLTRTHDRLTQAVARQQLVGGHPIKEIHRLVAHDLPLASFRRWCTVLCSPRLQGRYNDDPIGFCGQTDAVGVVGAKRGYFTRLAIHPSFASWALPEREPPRPFLLEESGLRVSTSLGGEVYVHLGTAELDVLRPGHGARSFAALVNNPGRGIHALDLQSLEVDPSLPEIPQDVREDVADELWEQLHQPVDLDCRDSDELMRIAAVLRRIDTLEAIASTDPALPKWARDPETARAELVCLLGAELEQGALRADADCVKKATRVICRALDNVLGRPALKRFAPDFTMGERLTYRPSS